MNEEDTKKQLCFPSLTGMFARSGSITMGLDGLHEVTQWGREGLDLWTPVLLEG